MVRTWRYVSYWNAFLFLFQIPAVVHFRNSATSQPQPMTINLNAGQVLLPLVGTSPQSSQPIVLRCTIPQASINTNTLSSSTPPVNSLASPSNIIIQQLTTPSMGNISSVPNLQMLQPLLQNIIQQNQTGSIAKVIIMPPTGKQTTQINTNTPTLSTLLNSTPTQAWQEPPAPILRIPGYDVLPTNTSMTNNSSKNGPSCTVSKPPPASGDNAIGNLTISNVFSLKDNIDLDKRLTAAACDIINIDEEDDMDQSNDDMSHDDDVENDLMRGDGHQVKAARRAAARMKRSTVNFPSNEEPYCVSADLEGEMRFQMKLTDDVDVYEMLPEVVTDIELEKYKPKLNSRSKILFPSPPTNSHSNISQNRQTKPTKACVKAPPPKMPRIAPKPKETPIIISSPTASRNVDDYIVPLAKCIPKELDDKIEIFSNNDPSTQHGMKVDIKKKTKIKVPQWKVGYVKRRKRKKTSVNVTTRASPVMDASSASPTPVVSTETESPVLKKSKESFSQAGYSTIRSLLNAPVGHMVTRSAKLNSDLEQDDVIEIEDKSEDSGSRSSSPSNLQGSGAKKQLRMMLLTKNKDKQDDDDVMNPVELDVDDVEMDSIVKKEDINVSDEIANGDNKIPTPERRNDKMAKKRKIDKNETDDEFKSDEETLDPEKMSDKIGQEIGEGIENIKAAKKESLKVKLSLKPTIRKGRRGRKAKKRKVETWNITGIEEEETQHSKDVEKVTSVQESTVTVNKSALLHDDSCNNPDEIATSGAEDDGCAERSRALEPGDADEKKKKPKSHKHKRKSKRKRKRKRDNECEEAQEEADNNDEISERVSSQTPNDTETNTSQMNSEHKILHLKEVLKQQQKQLDELRYRNSDHHT